MFAIRSSFAYSSSSRSDSSALSRNSTPACAATQDLGVADSLRDERVIERLEFVQLLVLRLRPLRDELAEAIQADQFLEEWQGVPLRRFCDRGERRIRIVLVDIPEVVAEPKAV
jgi:hypothetical protein